MNIAVSNRVVSKLPRLEVLTSAHSVHDDRILAEIPHPNQQLCHIGRGMDVAIIRHTFLSWCGAPDGSGKQRAKA